MTGSKVEIVERLVEEIVETVDDLLESMDPGTLERARGFLEDIRRCASDVGETVGRSQRATDRQVAALRGWLRGARRWTRE